MLFLLSVESTKNAREKDRNTEKNLTSKKHLTRQIIFLGQRAISLLASLKSHSAAERSLEKL
jgi:hypothetical protein